MRRDGVGGVRMTVRGLREREELLCGEVLVVGVSPRHRGVPELGSAATDALRKGKAAFDDGSGETAGGDATTSVATAADRETCAEVADSMTKDRKGTPKGRRSEKEKKAEAARKAQEKEQAEKKKDAKLESSEGLWDKRMSLGPGPELPRDGYEFLQAVNRRIDVVSVIELLLRSPDEKLTKSQAEQLLKLAYEKTERVETEEPYEKISANVPGD